MPRPFTDLGLQMLSELPPVLRGSYDYQAVIHTEARELALVEAAIERARAQLNPSSADLMLGQWEMLVKLPVGGAGGTVEQRQQQVVARLQKLLGTSEGVEWEDAITSLVGGGWTYLEHDPANPSGPPANTLRITLPFPPSGDAYANALLQIREVTPRHLDIQFESVSGFVLDESQLDLEVLTY